MHLFKRLIALLESQKMIESIIVTFQIRDGFPFLFVFIELSRITFTFVQNALLFVEFPVEYQCRNIRC